MIRAILDFIFPRAAARRRMNKILDLADTEEKRKSLASRMLSVIIEDDQPDRDKQFAGCVVMEIARRDYDSK